MSKREWSFPVNADMIVNKQYANVVATNMLDVGTVYPLQVVLELSTDIWMLTESLTYLKPRGQTWLTTDDGRVAVVSVIYPEEEAPSPEDGKPMRYSDIGRYDTMLKVERVTNEGERIVGKRYVSDALACALKQSVGWKATG
jgi:hypothetical protein